VSSRRAHSWAMKRKAPKPPDWSMRRWIWAMAMSGVPMTAKPLALRASTSSAALSVSGARGRAATRRK